MRTEFGLKNNDLNSLLLFENISIEKVSFEGAELPGKSYEIKLKEYKKGKLTKTELLFTTKGLDFLKIDTTYTSFKLFTKVESGKIKLFIQSPTMYGKQKYYKIKSGLEQDYILHNIKGENDFTYVSSDLEFPIFVIITPSINDGIKSSYCDVAQSDVKPADYWKSFKIPHYYVISMKFE